MQDDAHLLVPLDHAGESTQEAHVDKAHAQRDHDEGQRKGFVARLCGVIDAGLPAGGSDNGDDLDEPGRLKNCIAPCKRLVK